MSGKGKSAGGRGRGKALGTPQESRKRKGSTTKHVEGQAPGEKTGATKQQEPGPSREGKRKRGAPIVPVPDEDPESSEIESDEEEWKGMSKWQHNVPQSIETPDFVILSVPPTFKKLMWGGGMLT